MRTATHDAQDLAEHIDAFLVREYGVNAGDFHEHVMRAFEVSFAPRSDEVEQVDMTSEVDNLVAQNCLWAAYHLAKAKHLDAVGEVDPAYQEVIEAYKYCGDMTAYHLILKDIQAKAAPIKKAQAFRHLMTKEIESFAISRFRNGSFPSAHKASIALAPEVRQFAAEKGQPMSEDRASKTIYEWLLRSMKGNH